MPDLACCATCQGFVADLAIACLHCGAPPPRRRSLARFLLVRLLGVATAVTLMACYGDTSNYDCYGDAGCPCTSNDECDLGSYCELSSGYGTCVPGSYCNSDDACPIGTVCDLGQQTCVPDVPGACEYHDDCDVPYERCDDTTHSCVPTTPCTYEDQACGEGSRCDPGYGVCVPCEGAGCGACTGEITCTVAAPECPAGTRPAIEAGCYTQACIPEAVCTAEACLALDEVACTASAECDPSYAGINCTDPEGDPCTTSADCTCESFEYDTCVPAAPLPPVP